MARIAMFLVRSPGAPMTGRKAVINTAIEALVREGHGVDLYVLAKPGSAPASARQVFWLGTVPKVRMAYHAALSILGGERSLNEALFHSPRVLRLARGLRGAYDFAIADTIRAAPYAAALGVPWHLDLDDLFSQRYEKYLEQPGGLAADQVLGYYRDSVPGAAALPDGLVRRVLRREAARLREREVYWSRRATTVSLVSPEEAERFSQTAERRVYSLPMSVPIPVPRWKPGKGRAAPGTFLGGLDYKPNLDALLYYQEKIFPLLKAVPGFAPTLSHIGKAPSELRKRFLPEVVRFEGYVSDLLPRLVGAAFFVAPIVSGTGIKTKVLEAMAMGLPVLATRHAVSGLRVEHRNQCFICEGPAEFADGVRYLRDADLAERMGLSARNYVQTHFSMDVLRQRWRDVMHDLALAGGGGTRC